MFWPSSAPKTVRLPSVLSADERVVQLSASQVVLEPFLVLTERSVVLYDANYTVPVSLHKRSDESLEKYGANVCCKRNYDDSVVVVRTAKDCLLVYTISKPEMNYNSTDDEVLAVYDDANGNIIQNGLVIEKQSLFYQSQEIDNPILKYHLKFKLFLKISQGIVDFTPLSKFEVLLVTNTHTSFINCNTDLNETVDLDIDGGIQEVYNDKNSDEFLIKTGDSVYFYERANYGLNFVEKVQLEAKVVTYNRWFNLILYESDNKLVYYSCELKRVIREVELATQESLDSISWSPDGYVAYVTFSDGTWRSYSSFGQLIFASGESDCELNWLTRIQALTVYPYHDALILTDGTKLYKTAISRALHLINPINHNMKVPILVQDSTISLYVNQLTTNNSQLNWRNIEVPFEKFQNLLFINNVSFSNDGKFLAISSFKNLLIYSIKQNVWTFYTNDYSTDLVIEKLTWFENSNFLIVLTKIKSGSELILIDFKKFDHKKLDSDLVVFKYDFNVNVKLMNVIKSQILIFTENNKFFNFKIEKIGFNKIKIDLVKVLSLEKVFKTENNFKNIIKVNEDSQDFIILNNGELIYLKLEDNKVFKKIIVLNKIEYICYSEEINGYYCFNGESILIVKDLLELEAEKILPIKVQNYPILMLMNKGTFISLESSIIKKKNIEMNYLVTNSSIFLHEVIKFEMEANNEYNGLEVFKKYNKYKNFQYSLELLLYKIVVNNLDFRLIKPILKINPIIELNVVSRCLRKIEVKQWEKLFKNLDLTPESMLHECLEKKQFKTLGVLIIVLLNSKEDLKIDLVELLSSIVDNFEDDDELFEISVQLIKFMKILDKSLLKKSIDRISV